MHRTVLRIIKCSLFVIWAYICNIGRVVFMISYICLYIEYSLFVNITKMNEWSYIWKTKNYNKYEVSLCAWNMNHSIFSFLECPRSKDRMERFACPTPDFRSRYVSVMKIHKHNRNYSRIRIILDMKFSCHFHIIKLILIGTDALTIDLYAMVFLIARGRKTKIQSNAYSIRR